MSLDKATLEGSIKSAFSKAQGNTSERAQATLAADIAAAIDAYVKTASVSTNIAIGACVVVGSATTQTNAALIPATGTLS